MCYAVQKEQMTFSFRDVHLPDLIEWIRPSSGRMSLDIGTLVKTGEDIFTSVHFFPFRDRGAREECLEVTEEGGSPLATWRIELLSNGTKYERELRNALSGIDLVGALLQFGGIRLACFRDRRRLTYELGDRTLLVAIDKILPFNPSDLSKKGPADFQLEFESIDHDLLVGTLIAKQFTAFRLRYGLTPVKTPQAKWKEAMKPSGRNRSLRFRDVQMMKEYFERVFRLFGSPREVPSSTGLTQNRRLQPATSLSSRIEPSVDSPARCNFNDSDI